MFGSVVTNWRQVAPFVESVQVTGLPALIAG